MAKAPSKKSETTVTRIVASDSSKSTKKTAIAPKSTKASKEKVEVKAMKAKGTRKNPFAAIGAYFKGAWRELRQVRWPDRRATWGMTGALIAFTVFFVVVILLIDFGFAQLFNLITGK